MAMLSALELKRKKQSRVDEYIRLNEEYTKDGASPTEEQDAQLNAIYGEIANDGAYDQQIDRAEKFEKAQGIAAMGRESAGRVTDPLPHEDPNNTGKGKRQYSMRKAILEAAGWGEKETRGQYGLTGLEAEVDAELRKRRPSDQKPRGVLMPNTLPIDIYSARRWMESTGMRSNALESFAYTATELATTVESTITGAGAIEHRLGTMIDILRAKTVLGQMGVTIMDSVHGLFELPRQATATTAYWVGEGQDITNSAPTIDQVVFYPHTVGVRTPYTRRFLELASVSAENFLRTDQSAVLTREIERAALNGTGSSYQPLGLMQNPLVPLVAAGTNGAAPSWANIVGLETALANANADDGNLGYITDTAVRGLLKVTPKIGSTFPTYLWGEGNTLNGYRVGVTNLLPANLVHGSGTGLHALLFGDWSQMVIAYWSGMDVLVDPYTAGASASVIVQTMQDCDVGIKHPESFIKMMDVLVS